MMDRRNGLAIIALVLGLAGCASYPSNTRFDAGYQDGSYYSPADAGYGDYYYAPEPRNDYYDYYDPSLYYRYGSRFDPFGGYCSARYRYCPPFGYSPFIDPYGRFGFGVSFGGGSWYDPFWGRYGYPAPYYNRQPRHRHTPGNRSAPPTPQPQMADPDFADLQPGNPPRHEFRRPRPDPEMMIERSRPQPASPEHAVREPQQRRNAPSDASDSDSGGRKRSSRRGDESGEQRPQ